MSILKRTLAYAPPATGGTAGERSPGVVVAERYRLERVVGRGGLGEVWAALHTDLLAEVAVKFCLVPEADESFRENMRLRFQFEAQLSAKLSSSSETIVKVFDAGTHGDVPFLVMELVRGRSFEDVLRNDGALDPRRTLAILRDVARALETAHGAGVIHRDVKPANILVTERSDGTVVAKLTDFGIAKAIGPTAVRNLATTELGARIGTPDCMSPEQVLGGAIDERTDLWAFACVAYEALTGLQPFARATLGDTMQAIVEARYAPPSSVRGGLPAALDAWFARAYERERAERFPTVREAMHALESILGSSDARAGAASAREAKRTDVAGRPETSAVKRGGEPRWTKIAPYAAALVGCALGTSAGVELLRSRDRTSRAPNEPLLTPLAAGSSTEENAEPAAADVASVPTTDRPGPRPTFAGAGSAFVPRAVPSEPPRGEVDPVAPSERRRDPVDGARRRFDPSAIQ